MLSGIPTGTPLRSRAEKRAPSGHMVQDGRADKATTKRTVFLSILEISRNLVNVIEGKAVNCLHFKTLKLAKETVAHSFLSITLASYAK